MPSECFGGVTSFLHCANECRVVALVIRIPAQELPGEFRWIELNYVRVAGRRAPIGCWRHLWSPPGLVALTAVVPRTIAWLVIAAECSLRGVARKASRDAQRWSDQSNQSSTPEDYTNRASLYIINFRLQITKRQ